MNLVRDDLLGEREEFAIFDGFLVVFVSSVANWDLQLM